MWMDVRSNEMNVTFERQLEGDVLFVAFRRNEVKVRYLDTAQGGVQGLERFAQILLAYEEYVNLHLNALRMVRTIVKHRHEVHVIEARERHGIALRQRESAREAIRIQGTHTLILPLDGTLIAEHGVADIVFGERFTALIRDGGLVTATQTFSLKRNASMVPGGE